MTGWPKYLWAWGAHVGCGQESARVNRGACLIASALLAGIPVDISNFEFNGLTSALRFLSAGVLCGTATLLITLRWDLVQITRRITARQAPQKSPGTETGVRYRG
jgi:hypothetical protein